MVASMLAVIERIAGDGGVVVSTGTLMTRAVELAERHAISVYDAAYVAAVGEGDRRLVSCDLRDLVSNGLAELPGACSRKSELLKSTHKFLEQYVQC